MSLATRCTACGTVFRVVQDQLKVSEGWVRCGRCDEVFNALEGLFDLERDTPAEWQPGASVGVGDTDENSPGLGFVAREDAPGGDALADKVDAQLQAKSRHAGTTPAGRVSERDRLDFPDARFEPEAAEDETAPGIDMDRVMISDEGSAAAAAPTFIRRADRRARWRSPTATVALTFLVLLLGAGLSLQIAHHFRDVAAAQWPALRPVYAAWCGVLHCTVGPPALIDNVAVESTALTRDTAAPDAFRLAVTLRNRGPLVLALPSVDLTLTDAAGNLVARRVLAPQPASSATSSTTIQPGGESALQWLLSTGAGRVTGYTVEIFYP